AIAIIEVRELDFLYATFARSHRNGKPVSEITFRWSPWSASIHIHSRRQISRGNSEPIAKKLDLFLRRAEEHAGIVLERIVENHQPSLDLVVAFKSAVLGILISQNAIDELRLQVVHMPPRSVSEHFEMFAPQCIRDESSEDSSTFTHCKLRELATKE